MTDKEHVNKGLEADAILIVIRMEQVWMRAMTRQSCPFSISSTL